MTIIPLKKRHSINIEETNVDMRNINELMGEIDEAAKKIFSAYAIKLLDEPLSNVVEAVWGIPIDKSHRTSTQRQIDAIIRPMLRKIQDALEADELAGAKNCAIDYLIKRLAISEILFMTQCYKLNLLSNEPMI
jgi:hypothetical protein